MMLHWNSYNECHTRYFSLCTQAADRVPGVGEGDAVPWLLASFLQVIISYTGLRFLLPWSVSVEDCACT
jgi:hypothetical protein